MYERFAVMAPILARLPAYFAEKAFQNPKDSSDSPFQFVHETNLHFFAWLEKKPKIQQWFNTTMSLSAAEGKSADWGNPDFYPVKDRLLSGLDTNNEFILVDVGGGMGLDSMSD